MKWGEFKDWSPIEHWRMLRKWWKRNNGNIRKDLSIILIGVGLFHLLNVALSSSSIVQVGAATLFLVSFTGFMIRFKIMGKRANKYKVECPNPECENVITDPEKTICPNCLESLKINCPHCGELNLKTRKKCQHCGEKLSDSASRELKSPLEGAGRLTKTKYKI